MIYVFEDSPMNRIRSTFLALVLLSPMSAIADFIEYLGVAKVDGSYLTAIAEITSTNEGLYSVNNGGLIS
jgi:hypothetical protein